MKHRILIVEDNVMLAGQQKRWLEKSGYGVSTTIDELGARKRIKSEHFDLVLADVRLPEGNGISLLEWLRKEKIDVTIRNPPCFSIFRKFRPLSSKKSCST